MSLAVSIIPIAIIGGIQGFHRESIALIGLIFFVTFSVSYTIANLITKPIQKLTKKFDEISKGNLDVSLEPSEIKEINTLTESLNRVLVSLKLAIHKVGVKKGEIFEDAVKTKETFERKEKDMYNSIPGWAWETDAKGLYTFCSEKIKDLLDYEKDEIIGQSIFDFMTPEDAKNAKNIFNEASKKKIKIKNFENWNTTNNGEKICVKTNGFPFYDDSGNLKGYRGIAVDITQEKYAQNKIKELNTNISTLKMEMTNLLNEREKKKTGILPSPKQKLDEKWSEHEFDSVFIIDENANIIDCNENMYKRLGYSKGEMLSLNMSDFDALESKKDLKDKIKIAKKNGAHSFKTIHKRKDGSAILVQENLQYIKDKNEFKAIVREDYSLKKTK